MGNLSITLGRYIFLLVLSVRSAYCANSSGFVFHCVVIVKMLKTLCSLVYFRCAFRAIYFYINDKYSLASLEVYLYLEQNLASVIPHLIQDFNQITLSCISVVWGVSRDS